MLTLDPKVQKALHYQHEYCSSQPEHGFKPIDFSFSTDVMRFLPVYIGKLTQRNVSWLYPLIHPFLLYSCQARSCSILCTPNTKPVLFSPQVMRKPGLGSHAWENLVLYLSRLHYQLTNVIGNQFWSCVPHADDSYLTPSAYHQGKLMLKNFARGFVLYYPEKQSDNTEASYILSWLFQGKLLVWTLCKEQKLKYNCMKTPEKSSQTQKVAHKFHHASAQSRDNYLYN